ncbi:hypothetical protein D3C81_1839380 [compost metagenome]
MVHAEKHDSRRNIVKINFGEGVQIESKGPLHQGSEPDQHENGQNDIQQNLSYHL